MPHSTCSHPFELRILQWAGDLTQRLTGGNKRFVLVLDGSGTALRILFGEVEKPDAAEAAWVFYDPFDVPEYTFMEWHNVSLTTFERLVGAPFSAPDFEAIRPSVRGSAPVGSFPASWNVMF